MFTPVEIGIAVVVLAAMIFVPILRRLLGLIIRLAVFFVAVGIAAAGVTMILNNETIFERPGFGQRVQPFLTKNSAAAYCCRGQAAQARRKKRSRNSDDPE